MVHYATFHLPVEPDGFYKYNPLQQLAYAGVVFCIAPVSLLTGLAMSPAVDSRFNWYPKLFGGRQCASAKRAASYGRCIGPRDSGDPAPAVAESHTSHDRGQNYREPSFAPV